MRVGAVCKTTRRIMQRKVWKDSGVRTPTSRKTQEFTSETSDRCLQELNLLCCWQLSTLYTCNSLSTVSGACGCMVNSRQLLLARAVRAAFTEHVMPFSSQPWWGWQQRSTEVVHLDWTYWCLYRNGKAAVTVLARFTGMFLSDLCLRAKAYVLYADGANVCLLVSSEMGSVWRDMLLPVCFSATFCGLNLRTVQLSLDKLRAPLGYRGLVLGLDVGKPERVFFLWVLPMEHVAEQTQPSASRDIDYGT